MNKEEVKDKSRWQLAEVPTQVELVIVDTEKKEQYTDKEVLVYILNKLDNLEKKA